MGCMSSKQAEPAHKESPPPAKQSDPSPAPVSSPPPAASPSPAAEPAKVQDEPKKIEPPKDDDETLDELMTSTPITDSYDLGKEIGRGGFSVVVEGTHKKTQEKFAIKCVKKSMIEGDDVKLLRREIHIMKKVDHSNILKLYEVFEDQEHFYLVMELVTGKELFDKIVERGQYSEEDASNVIRQLVSAVEYLHANGIAHRDLKPENLLSADVDGKEIIKIADFGFSKNFGEEKLMTSCGSPGYVAPEVLTCESYDNSVDMWSVGVIMYILLCGSPPFYADNAPALFKKIMEVQYDFDDPTWEEISKEAKDLISGLLVKDPKKRFSAQECRENPWVQGKINRP
mmetsp:Transcript_14633/g.37275  ORF Transcript_14633/g.37275 Transcript_14633/m.37275 type:complete len:342 (-) Transcript_14633:188-1213(-)